MSSTLSFHKEAQQAAASLRSAVMCEVLLPTDADYNSAIRVWNCDISTQPAIVVLCRTTADVQLAVETAVSLGLPLSVRGGGYDIHGRAVCAGMVLSMQHMRSVAINTSNATVTFGGGCTIGDVAKAVSAHQRAVVTGTVAEVGLTGWTLGGGYGQLNGRYGLGVDNVVSAEVVLADGSLVTASARQDAELLWCLQGGGGGFGVVASMTVRTHPVSEVVAGAIMFALDEAAAVLRGYQKLIYQQPDALGCMFFIVSGPDGSPLLVLSPHWAGSIEEGQRCIQPFEQLGKPVMSQVGAMPWVDTFKATEGRFPPGRASAADCRCVSSLSDAAIEVLVDAARRMPSPHTAIICHDMHGAAARVAADATAYPIRQSHLLIELVTVEESEAVSDKARAWLQQLSSALAPHSLSQSWPQLVGRTDEDEQRTQQTYSHNLPRLLAVKQRVDPRNVFASSVVPLPV